MSIESQKVNREVSEILQTARYVPVKLKPEDRTKLLAHGFVPVPIDKKKAILIPGWESLDVTDEWLSRMVSDYPDHEGTGLRLDSLVAIDLDVTDANALNLLAGLLLDRIGDSALYRMGSKGLAVVLNSEGEIPRMVLSFKIGGKSQKVEILTRSFNYQNGRYTNRQLGGFGHMVTKSGEPFEYRWRDGISPLTLPAYELTSANAFEVLSLLETMKEKLESIGAEAIKISITAAHLDPDKAIPGGMESYVEKLTLASPSEATGTPIPLSEFCDTLSRVNPAIGRDSWIAIAGAFHNSYPLLRGADGEPVPGDEVQSLFLQWCSGDLWLGKKAAPDWEDDGDGIMRPSSYLNDGNGPIMDPDEDALAGLRTTGFKKGGAGYGSLKRAAMKETDVPLMMDLPGFDGPGEYAPQPSPQQDDGLDGPDESPVDKLTAVFLKNISDSAVYMSKLEKPDFLIDNWIPEFGHTSLLAVRGSGKTIFGAHAAVAYSHDQPFHMSEPVKGGFVFYFPFEDATGLKSRILADCDRRGIKFDPTRCVVLPEARLDPFHSQAGANPDQQMTAFAKAMLAHVMNHPDVIAGKIMPDVMVIFDTWQVFTQTADEGQNSGGDMAKAFMCLDFLIREYKRLGGRKIGTVSMNHPTKGNQHTISGSFELENRAHSIIEISDEGNRQHDCSVIRPKNFEAPPPITFMRESVLLMDHMGNPFKAPAFTPVKGREPKAKREELSDAESRSATFAKLALEGFAGRELPSNELTLARLYTLARDAAVGYYEGKGKLPKDAKAIAPSVDLLRKHLAAVAEKQGHIRFNGRDKQGNPIPYIAKITLGKGGRADPSLVRIMGLMGNPQLTDLPDLTPAAPEPWDSIN